MKDNSNNPKKMLRLFSRSVQVLVGTAVTVKVEKRDRSHTNPGVMGVVYKICSDATKGVRVVTEHGILCSGVQKLPMYLPPDMYTTLRDRSPVNASLNKIKENVLFKQTSTLR